MKFVVLSRAGARVAVTAFLAMTPIDHLAAEPINCPCPKPPGGSHACDDDQIAYCKVKDGECVGWCGSLATPAKRGEKLAAAIFSEGFREKVTPADLQQDPQYRQAYQNFLELKTTEEVYEVTKGNETVYFKVPPRTQERIADLQRQESGSSRPWFRRGPREIGEEETIDDAGITAAVKARLSADGDINPFNIDVDTNDGVVTLQGSVAQQEARTKAEQAAREVDGVKRVINLIKVGEIS